MNQNGLDLSAKIFAAISLLLAIYSCTQKQKLVVQPISEEFNREYITGKGLNTQFYNPNDVMQYYQVSHFDNLTDNSLLTKLDSFAMASFLPASKGNIKSLTFLFYEKEMFVDYRDNLYESAREDENRHLIGYNDKLLANISFERLKSDPKKMSVQRLLYGKDKLKLEAIDTISVQ